MNLDTVRHDVLWMQAALEQADLAASRGEVPVGAVLVQDGRIIGAGHNAPITTCDPTAHAEIQAIRAASQSRQNYRLPDTTLYVTLEPCPMCAGAIVHARIARVVIAALEPRAGAIVSTQRFFDGPQLNHRVAYDTGVLADDSSIRLKTFFAQRRPSRKQP